MGHEALDQGLAELSRPYRVKMVGVGLDESGTKVRLVTAMGGSSINSQNREYVQDGDVVRTKVFDPRLPSGDPDKTIYQAHAHRGKFHVASNGYQTMDIADGLYATVFFAGTQRPLKHEDDPAKSSRIQAAVELGRGPAYLGRISANELDSDLSDRTTYERELLPGVGYVIFTYNGSGTTFRSQEAPYPLPFKGTAEEQADLFFDQMDPNTTAGLALKEVEIDTGKFIYVIRGRAEEFTARYRASLPGSV
jgi:hypothetical protein